MYKLLHISFQQEGCSDAPESPFHTFAIETKLCVLSETLEGLCAALAERFCQGAGIWRDMEAAVKGV
jgi:hypothetical protein